MITSLKDTNLKEKYLDTSNIKYKNIQIPDGMTIGLEIECEGKNSLYCYVLEKFLDGYTSLEEIIKIVELDDDDVLGGFLELKVD